MADPTTMSSSTDTGSGSKDGSNGGPKAIIKNVDMSEEMQQESVDITSAALEKYNIEKDIAAQIKKEFDRRHGPTWHVVVGKNFGSYVTHGEMLFDTLDKSSSPIWSFGLTSTLLLFRVFVCFRSLIIFFSSFLRDQALHLLLRWIACCTYMEVIDFSLDRLALIWSCVMSLVHVSVPSSLVNKHLCIHIHLSRFCCTVRGISS
jgi:dynein light chain LC8-type